MDAYRKWIDSLPLLVKIIFALPILDGILFGIYRICKGNLPNIVSRDYLDFCRRDDFLDSRHYFPALERKSIRALTSL